MKKLFAPVALLLVAAVAHATVESAKGDGFTRAAACQSAKELAAAIVKTKYNSMIRNYSECSCSSSKVGSATSWICTVDAYY